MQLTASARLVRVPARYVLFAAVAAALMLGAVGESESSLARPTDDREVLARVPARSDRDVRALEQLRKSAELAPSDLPAALRLARSYIEASRRDGDPRYLGAAEGALARWTALPDPAPEVRLLRATILQSRHEFAAALADLDRVVATVPDNAQAWLTRATVLTVEGDYAEARKSCSQLASLVSGAYAVACSASIDAVTGRALAAQTALAAALRTARSRDELAWLHSLLGEQAYWSGDAGLGQKHLQAALELDPSDRYSRAVYADLLLEAGRNDEARKLVRDHTSDDALALRAALADLAQGKRDSGDVARVEQNFEASRLRGDTVHRREEARFWLARGDAERALRCARESWAAQHEPWDARLILEAALAAARPDQAASVLAWLDETKNESPTLQNTAARLRAL